MNKIRLRGDAIKRGERFFFTGKSCKNGHLSLRYTRGGSCVQCNGVKTMLRIGISPDRVGSLSKKQLPRLEAQKAGLNTYIPYDPCKRGHSLRWVGTNNCVICDNETREKHKINRKFNRIKKIYNLKKEEYLTLVKIQLGKCAICGHRPNNYFSLHIDHCHKTKKIRGLLCGMCNQALGLLREDVKIIQSLSDYINDFS